MLLSNDLFNQRSGTVMVMAITGQQQQAGFPLTLPLPEGTLPRPSWVKISQIRTISTERLGKKLGSLEPAELDQVVEGLLELIT